ncbi:hypothetical protein OF83DRAFT_1167841 [Amylostereum chailletii]|nr:hypothetical protein OF83DRAFT_1167841 [Amylostereum chailletii]
MLDNVNTGARTVTPNLPPEIWAIILRYATERTDIYPVTYRPFLPSFLGSVNFKSDSGLDVKSVVALVCKTWRALSMEFLYEHVFIRHAALSLQHTLERGTRIDDLPSPGRWVRRAHLPYAFSETPFPKSDPIPAISILSHCPSLQILHSLIPFPQTHRLVAS